MASVRTVLGVTFCVAVVMGVQPSAAVEGNHSAHAEACAAEDVGGCVVTGPLSNPVPDPARLLQQVRATYAALTSYSDTGILELEEKPMEATMPREQHAFTTRYAAPHQFYFDFRKGDAEAERFVLWSLGKTFSSWGSAMKVKEDYAEGEDTNAFAMATQPTAGAALLIPSLLFQNAGLQGPLLTMTKPRYGGSQKLGEHLTHVLTGIAHSNPGDGRARVISVWVDARTLMIRKVFEYTPTGQGGTVQRVTATFEPVPGAKIDEAQFRFAPPR